MKTIKHIIIISLVAFLSFACKKTINNGKQYTVEGRFMYNCETPASNEEFSFRQGTPGLIEIKDPLMRVVKTDAEGYFKIVYNGKESNGSAFRIMKSGTIMDDIPASENVNVGNVYFSPTYNFIIRLNVLNPYTSNDTLEIPNYNDIFNENNNRLYIPGPFENGVIDTVWNYPYMSGKSFNSVGEYKVQYRINSDWQKSYFDIPNFCNIELHESVITIE